MKTAIIGDNDTYRQYGHSHEDAVQMLAVKSPTLAEVIYWQILRIAADCKRIAVYLGPQDLREGYGESYVHARVVELCDNLQHHFPRVPITIHGIAATDPEIDPELIRTCCNAAARNVAELRHIEWVETD